MDPLTILAMAAETVQQSDSYKYKSAPDFIVRKARHADIPFLGPVERSAAEIFRTVDLDFLPDGTTIDPASLESMVDSNHLWVAVDRNDRPIGFAGGDNLDGNFHLLEISVARPYQGNGVGRILMGQMTEAIKREGYKTITLTTYRNLPWNGLWYTRMGFMEVPVVEMGPIYWRIWQIEAQHGFDMRARCVMMKIL